MKRTSFEIRGWHVLAGMLAFFGAIIAINIAFAVLAVRSFPGEDVRRSYVQGLQYNATLAKRRAQAELGWQAQAGLRTAGAGALVFVTLQDRRGRPLDGAVIEGELQRPASDRLDRALTFEQSGAGLYVAHLDDLPGGRWRLRARAGRGRDALDFEAALSW